MAVPDFLIWHCDDCGTPAEGTKKPCGCATNVGTRKGPNGRLESTWWDAPPDPRDATIDAQSAALALAREALEFGVSRFSELDQHDPNDQIADDGSTVWNGVAHEAERFVTRARSALAAIKDVVKQQ